MTTIGLIYVKTREGLIGYKNQLPWIIVEDLKRFREQTLHSTVLMGRHTWESIPTRPLPNRTSIVVTHRPIEDYSTVQTYAGSLHNLVDNIRIDDPTMSVWCIGGADLLAQMVDYPHLNTIVESVIDGYDMSTIDKTQATMINTNWDRHQDWECRMSRSCYVCDRALLKSTRHTSPPEYGVTTGYYRLTEYHYERR